MIQSGIQLGISMQNDFDTVRKTVWYLPWGFVWNTVRDSVLSRTLYLVKGLVWNPSVLNLMILSIRNKHAE